MSISLLQCEHPFDHFYFRKLNISFRANTSVRRSVHTIIMQFCPFWCNFEWLRQTHNSIFAIHQSDSHLNDIRPGRKWNSVNKLISGPLNICCFDIDVSVMKVPGNFLIIGLITPTLIKNTGNDPRCEII